jgi:hypothetical protein
VVPEREHQAHQRAKQGLAQPRTPDGLTSHSHTQGPYAHLREAEADAERQERYIESLEAERDQWKAGTFPGWTRDDVYKELADKYRELEAERDELRGALERAIARQAPEGTGDA